MSTRSRQEELDEKGFVLCQPVLADCGLRLCCERVNYRGEDKGDLITLDLSTALDSRDECPFYTPRAILKDEGAVLRGKRRHNKHAPPSRLESQRPSLMVKRHIRNGKDINRP